MNARLLQSDPILHTGKEYFLTGGKEDVLSCEEVAALFSSLLGFEVKYQDDTAYFHEMLGEELATIFADYLQWQQQTVGDCYDVTDQVKTFLGREPRKFREWIEEHAEFFRKG